MLGQKIYENVTGITVESYGNHPVNVHFVVENTETITEEVDPTMLMNEVVSYLNDNYKIEIKY